jgi:AcrR family transcriptional regulator
MEHQRLPDRRRRNRNFDETHRLLIEKAVELISAMGTEALSISALARESGINRSTVYYHFDSREELIAAVQDWSAEQISRGFSIDGGSRPRVVDAIRFVIANPEVMKLWIDEFISAGDIRDRFPLWDQLIADAAATSSSERGGEHVDPAALAAIVLAGGLVGARVYFNSASSGSPPDDAIERFARTHSWLLRLSGML